MTTTARSKSPQLRLGLCCQFAQQPIGFRTTTATALLALPKRARLAKLADICSHNADSLLAALRFCAANGIGSFRISSPILPVVTHPKVCYLVGELPGGDAITAKFRACGAFARENGVRTGFHPDQFVVLNSPNPAVVANAVADLESQAALAELVNADTVNIHAGGGYGDKPAALARFAKNLSLLSDRACALLTVENDDRTFTPADLLPICRAKGVPLVYDAHHHRCNRDTLSVDEATEAAVATWRGREPLFHISSPLNGWKGATPERHHDYINPRDFPKSWLGRRSTAEVEAKAKELAVLRLMRALARR
jgi:UV DNA damage endonuclease